jgi:hypothetical protein
MAPPRLLRHLACALPALAAGAALADEPTSRFDCRVTGSESLPGLASTGGVAKLTRFTCRVRGGVLDGFQATGTNIWDGEQRLGVLLGSLVVARKDTAVVVYELTRVTRDGPRGADDRSWEGRGTGIYRLATGPAVALAGRTFRSVARSAGPGAFTIETVVEDR